MMLRVKSAATREKHCALDVSDCRAATLATLSARIEFAVELFPTPVFPAQAITGLLDQRHNIEKLYAAEQRLGVDTGCKNP